MTAQEIISKIKQMFDTPTPPPAVPDNSQPMTNITVDGKTVVVNGPVEVGSDVTVDGAPAPAGDYQFPDGSVISVDSNAKISAVSIQPQAPPPGLDMNAEIGQMKSNFEAHKQAFEDYKTSAAQRFANAENTIATQSQALAKQDEVIKQLFSLCEQLAGAPSAEPLGEDPKQPKFSFSKVEGKKKSIDKFKNCLSALQTNYKNN